MHEGQGVFRILDLSFVRFVHAGMSLVVGRSKRNALTSECFFRPSERPKRVQESHEG